MKTKERQLRVFKALADETRLGIVEFLLKGEKCVCKIHPHVERTQPTVSIQLAKLERFGIVKRRRDGRYMFYSIADPAVRDVIGSFKKKIKRCDYGRKKRGEE